MRSRLQQSPTPGHDPVRPSGPGRCRRLAAVGSLLLLLCSGIVHGQVNVRTIGGGRLTAAGPDAGFVDGSILQLSQFSTPAGIATDSAGLLYVADYDNGALRKLDLAADRSTTLMSGLDRPIAVATAGANQIFILTEGGGRILRIDRFGNPSVIASGLRSPTALAVDARTNLFVTEARGTVVRIDPRTGGQTVISSTLNSPAGIAALDNGLLAVSDTGNHQVRFLNSESGATYMVLGAGLAGFRDGPASTALFNRPQHLAKAPSGRIVVADRGNHRIRILDTLGVVTTAYGIDSQDWESPECITCDPIILPGWFDSSANFAEVREPYGITVAIDGRIYSTEVHYHLVREATGVAGLVKGEEDEEDPTAKVLAPIIDPSSGYFPMGQSITVTDPNPASFLPAVVYYTLDGTSPTTNSFRLELQGNTGQIAWQSSERDLTSLRLRTFIGDKASDVVAGQPASISTIGVPRDITAGMGSMVVVPVVVNLRTNDPLKSLQFRVEVAPVRADGPIIPETFDALNISTNDFVRVVTSDEEGSASSFSATGYLNGRARGLVITMIGTTANFSTANYSVVAMLAVPMPPDARVGDRYRIDIVRPSGTSDGGERSVTLSPDIARHIIIDHVSYEVGDSATAVWYNADAPGFGFGNDLLDNADVNNAFAASLGSRLPYRFSDLFDSMDAFPKDTPDAAGGDGLIRFLDWQVILQRSLGLDPERWTRTWSDGGIRVARLITSTATGLASSPAVIERPEGPGAVWVRQAAIKAGTVDNVLPARAVDVPIWVTVSPGEHLGGLAFRAIVSPEAGTPAIGTPLTFIPAAGTPPPVQQRVPDAVEQLMCGWPLVPAPSFTPPLQGTRLLGHLRIPIPGAARAGSSYVVRFANPDGAADLQTQFDLESIPGRIWVLSGPRLPDAVISDEWRSRFFGNVDHPDADDALDPDGDGVANRDEFQAGTDPSNRESRLKLDPPARDPGHGTVSLRWLSAPGRRYVIEGSDHPGGPWKTVAGEIPGDGRTREWIAPAEAPRVQFYRLRLQP